MATAFASTVQQLTQEMSIRFANLSEQQRRELLLRTASALSSNASNPDQAQAQHVPRSMASFPTPNMTQLPPSNLGSMDRVQSAPAPSTMDRSTSAPGAQPSLQRCNSSTAGSWQTPYDEQAGSAYAIYPESASMRTQPSLQPITEPTSMVEYTPDEFINNIIGPSGSSPLSPSHPHPQSQRQLQVQLTTDTQWCPSLDGSPSPSTPASTLMTPVTQSMSRQNSCNSFLDDLPMLRVQSDSSSLFPLLSEDGNISFSDVTSENIKCVDNPHFLATPFTGLSSESFLSTALVSNASVNALASSENEPYLAEDMRRSASSSSGESDLSNASAPSTGSRQARRDREINAQAVRCKIAPKAVQGQSETKSPSSNIKMMRIQSGDGSSKNVGVITKAPYIRPQHPKILCTSCNERPEGFRGTHELERHIARAHTAIRKGFVCVDYSTDKKFLANCKHCRNKKVYGAYYNAAAHLRRAHFHPRKRGRKGKHDEKRGGIGGGDDPPMDYLKQHWIREVEVENKHAPQSPESASGSVENSFDSTYENGITYQPLPQPLNDVPMSIGPTQYFDYNMCMTESEPFFNSPMIYMNEPDSTSDINTFEFDAYRAQ